MPFFKFGKNVRKLDIGRLECEYEVEQEIGGFLDLALVAVVLSRDYELGCLFADLLKSFVHSFSVIENIQNIALFRRILNP